LIPLFLPVVKPEELLDMTSSVSVKMTSTLDVVVHPSA